MQAFNPSAALRSRVDQIIQDMLAREGTDAAIDHSSIKKGFGDDVFLREYDNENGFE
jgi:uncharacterized protein YheU (UPF0270 family)